ALACAIQLVLRWKWILPRVTAVHKQRSEEIQGNLDGAEATRREAEAELARYREQVANAREEANRIIQEARKTAEQLRADLQGKAEQEARATVARATEEIRAERDRVLRELSAQVGQIAVELAERVAEKELDKTA